MSPAEEKNLHRRIDDLITVVSRIEDNLKESRRETIDLIKEVKHECKADILQVKDDHCTRLNTHSANITKNKDDLTKIKNDSKWVSLLVSFFVTVVGFIFSRMWR
jgi:hypothetical protein